jgi:hypothetical protein
MSGARRELTVAHHDTIARDPTARIDRNSPGLTRSRHVHQAPPMALGGGRQETSPKAKILMNNLLFSVRWFSLAGRHQFGWTILTLGFVFSVGVHVFLALSTAVTWPVRVAVAGVTMAGFCASAAFRER